MNFNLLVVLIMFNFPILLFGNTTSSAIFLADILILYSYFNFNLYKNWNRKLITVFLLVLYISIMSSLRALETPSQSNFIVYGIFRLFVFFIFFQSLHHTNISKVINSNLLINIISIYSIFHILNSLGVLDLSLVNYTGHSFINEIDYLKETVKTRIYLGNNSTNTSTILFFGIFVLKYRLNRHKFTNLLIILFFVSILFTGSRTDIIAVLFFLFTVSNFSFKKVLFIFLVYVIYSLELLKPLLPRIYNLNIIGELQNKTDGTLNYRSIDWVKAFAYQTKNINDFLFGFGINNFRILRSKGIVLINFGHNTFIHSLIELGFIATLFILNKLRTLVTFAFKTKNKRKSFLIATIIYLVVKTLTTDVLISTDNTLSLNVIIISILYIISMEPYNSKLIHK